MPMKALVPLTAILLLQTAAAVADAPPAYSLVRIQVADVASLREIWNAGIDFEGSSGKPGGPMEFVVTAAQVRELTRRGIALDVVEPDLSAAALKGLARGPLNALGFGTGSMGGYYTLAEVGAQLDSMRLLFPSLVSAKQEIGGSVEGRPIWAVRISDNPDADEPDEPEVLYTALTHAREPAGMMSVIYYMWWLLGEYGTDPTATYLVNNRQIWFIPVVNVDGYAYNESTNPSGGGFWRKNRRNNGNGTYGIDLNRNYGPDYMWNAPNGGSSTTPGSDTYRGPTPFSEPETQTIDVFMRLHRIRTCLNYHTYGGLLIYPYGYLGTESEEWQLYREFAFDLTRVNRYLSGTDLQTVNYSTRGNSDDYMYGDTTKFRTYAMTPEVGTSFWPPSGDILPLALENLGANIVYSALAGAMPVVSSCVPSDSTALRGFLPGAPFSLRATIRNRGLDTADHLTASFSSDSGVLHFMQDPLPVTSLPPRSDTLLVLEGTVDGSALPGSSFRLFVRLNDPHGYVRTDTITLYLGKPSALFTDDAESGTSLWATEGSWGISPDAHSGTGSFHDSPSGPSQVSSSAGIQTASPVDLHGYSAVRLEFWTKWAIEPAYDFGVVRISTDGGAGWSDLRTALSNDASGHGRQVPGSFGYDAYTPDSGWVRQEADLSAYAGTPVILRFELDTDGSDSRDGWYIDDVAITGYRATLPGGAITVTTASHSERGLYFGEWPGAGAGIDTSLGESELGAVPPPGTFDARWEIPGTNGSLIDIRDTLGTSVDTNVFTLRFQAPGSDYPLRITWDRGSFARGVWRLTGAPAPPAADMWLSGEVLISDTSVAGVNIVHTQVGTLPVIVQDKWSLVSLPVIPADSSVAALFPDALPHAFRFSTEYMEEEYLSAGSGYWIRNDGTGVVAMTGVPFDRNEVSNPSGVWRIVGSVYCPLPRSAVCPSCLTPPVLFGYRNGYFIPDTLLPGEGYWYRGSETLVLDCRDAALPPSPRPGQSHGIPPGSLSVSDETGAVATLGFGVRRRGEYDPGDYRLPPVPPGNAFDARFESENGVEYFESGAAGGSIGIRVTNGRGNTTMTFHGDDATASAFSLELRDPGGAVSVVPFSDGRRVVVPAGSVARLLFTPGERAPGAFRVYGNYPNPFNPRTSIRYDLAAPARVSLRVRNIAGQEVDNPVSDLEVGAGEHVIVYDAGRLASGVYFYTLTAVAADPLQSGRSSGKFIILK
jgi:carboxypeptidase T